MLYAYRVEDNGTGATVCAGLTMRDLILQVGRFAPGGYHLPIATVLQAELVSVCRISGFIAAEYKMDLYAALSLKGWRLPLGLEEGTWTKACIPVAKTA